MRISRYTLFAALVGALLLGALGSAPASAKTIKVAYIDPLSGPFGPVGILDAQGFKFMFDRINKEGILPNGDKLELVPFDDKVDPKTAQIDAQKAVDQGIRFLLQGNGSNVAFALINWVKKHNRNNPKDKVLYLNYAAIDPGLSNADCGFYHFNFDANVNMKVAGLVSYLKGMKDIHKVYLMNMDYSFGHSVAEAAKEMLHRERPDIKIVGDDFTPIGQTKDYTPYINKIRKSGAQAVITGNWGADMTLLVKAAGQADLKGVKFFTFYGGIPGTPQAIGELGAGRVVQITPWAAGNYGSPAIAKIAAEFKQQYNNDFYYGSQLYLPQMFARAIKMAGEPNPTKVALALEGMHYHSLLGDVYLRADNHAAVMPMVISTLEKGVKPYLKGTKMNFKVNTRIAPIKMFLPTNCKMEDRPKGATSPNAFYNNVGK
ncbi:MAG TPA: branched-chain amino acid ABC transporter substrate-binding protein [Gammaproteobacteria bacterium]|nr:branched-chain amino acid ABC transporter substrate-binding protein [Gammaproteobacteria bacterium]